MNLSRLVFLVIAIASLPVIPAWIYFYSRKAGGIRLLASVGSGFLSVFIALIVQRFFSFFPDFAAGGIAYIFVRIALAEEISRLVVLFPVLAVWRRKDAAAASRNPALSPDGGFPDAAGLSGGFGGMEAGFMAGLGFAAAESVFYAAAVDPGIALVRAFSAAPLHGACGARVGSSFGFFYTRPSRAATVFLSAVLIHGFYNFFILNPATPSILSLLTAFAALGSSLLTMRYHRND